MQELTETIAASVESIPVDRTTRRLSAEAQNMFWLYLLLVAAAELITSLLNTAVGMGAHLVVMLALLVHSTIGHSDQKRKLAPELTLAPMIRVLSLSTPLINFPQIDWYLIVSIPLLAATWVIIEQSGVKPGALGFSVGDLGLQIMLAGSGLGR